MLIFAVNSKNSLAQTNTWVQKNDLGYNVPNYPATTLGSRTDAVGFSIGSKGYFGTGYGAGPEKDFWEYDPVTNTWTQKADFGGTARYSAVGFSIGSKGYIGTGFGIGDIYSRRKDFWEYDPAANTWTQKMDFGGTARTDAVGFSIGSKGYIGTGYDGSYRQDFWEYDPAANTWKQKADFGGTGRQAAIGFSIGRKGYTGTGSGLNFSFYKDFWEYDPATNTWTQKADFGGITRADAVGFGNGSKGYIGTGVLIGPDWDWVDFPDDFWEYDPAANTWKEKANFAGNPRSLAFGFCIGGKGYIGTGYWEDLDWYYYDLKTFKDFWEFDFAANTWTEKKDIGGNGRSGAVSFSIGSKGYIGIGKDPAGYNDDFWEYDPLNKTWAQKADFKGNPRIDAIGFSIDNKGYVGMGFQYDRWGGEYYNDIWEYDPVINEWINKIPQSYSWGQAGSAGFSVGDKGYIIAGYDEYGYENSCWEFDPRTNSLAYMGTFGQTQRKYAVGFSIGVKGYIGTGESDYPDDVYYKDFWEFDPATYTWTQKADFGGTPRSKAVGFSIGSKGYIGTGYDGTNTNDFWEYDPVANTWRRKTDFGGTARSGAAGFSIGNRGFIATGFDDTYKQDLWEYTPDVACPDPANLSVSKISDTCASLKWTMPPASVKYISVIYRPVGTATWKIRRKKSVTNTVYISDLKPNTTYEWKIVNICAHDTTRWVAGPNFTTKSSTVSASIAAALTNDDLSVSKNLVIKPNPTDGNFTVRMQLPVKPALTTLAVYNNAGERIWQQDAGHLSGQVSRNIELQSKLSAGVYVLMVQHGDTRLMQKVVVMK